MDIKPIIRELAQALSNAETEKVKRILKDYPTLLKDKPVNISWLHEAAGEGNLEIVKYILDSGEDINSIDKIYGSMPIDCAASNGHIDIVKYLLDNGAQLDIREPECNPLFAAIYNNHYEIVKLLIDSGIDVSIEYGTPETPHNALSYAKRYGREDIANLIENAMRGQVPNSYMADIDKSSGGDYVLHHLKQYFNNVSELSLMEILGDLSIHLVSVPKEYGYGQDCKLLFTSGSQIKNKHGKFELMIILPGGWNLDELDDENNYWPIEWLRRVAHYEIEINPQDTLSNEKSFEPLASNTKLAGFIVLPEMSEFGKFTNQEGQTVTFLMMVPLYKEEVKLKRKKGTVELLERFAKNRISMVVDPNRKNVG